MSRKLHSKDEAVIADFLNEVYCDERRIFHYFWCISIHMDEGIGLIITYFLNALKMQTTGELGHKELLANRIQELGDSSQSEPAGWATYSIIGVFDLTKHLTLHLEAERAFEFEGKIVENYNNLAKKTLELGDHVTYNLATTILANQMKDEQIEDVLKSL
jgi:ferritin-like protein